MAGKNPSTKSARYRPSGRNVKSVVAPPLQPLVFISHDTRDADLAQEFDSLLRAASGGAVKSFRSSDLKGTSGIEYGTEWHEKLMTNLFEATVSVTLLTPYSVDRPWVLYETGIAKGRKIPKVVGLILGIPVMQANKGPLYHLENCPNEEETLTKLVREIIIQNPLADPDPRAILDDVREFRKKVGSLLKGREAGFTAATDTRLDESALARLFEETKSVLRDVSERLPAKETLKEPSGQAAWLRNAEIGRIIEITGRVAALASAENREQVEKFLLDIYLLIRDPLQRAQDFNAHDTFDLFERTRRFLYKKWRYQPPPPNGRGRP